jgi:hypothetical protein
MVAPRRRPHDVDMPRYLVPLLVLIPFTLFSTWLVIDTGYLAWIRLCGREPWALQLLLDLIIACATCVSFMIPDARARGLRVAPYVALVATLGSIGILAYLIRRQWPTPTAVASGR